MMSEPSLGRLSDIAISHRQTVDPKNLDEIVVDHYSLPAWPNLEPETISPLELKSNKLVLPNECVLVSKLNPKRHKTWRVSTNHSRVSLASTEWAVLIPKDENISIDYLYTSVTDVSFQNQLKSKVTGTSSSHQRVRLSDILSSSIPRFDSKVETNIGSLIGAIRNLLKLKSTQHKLLESYCELLFKSWFIDFTPVSELDEGHPSLEVNDEIAGHFPGEFEESPLGRIPMGWEIYPLEELISISRGLSYNAASLCEKGGVPFHTANSVLEGGRYKFAGIKYYSGDFSEKHTIKPNDIIVATLEQSFDHALVGHVARIPTIYGDEGIYSGDLFKVDSVSDKVTKNWIYSLLKSEKMHKQIIQYSNGTTINRIPQDSLKRPLVAVPPRNIIDAFDNIVTPIHQLCDHNISTINKLSALRDDLLPLLMTGVLGVKGVGAEPRTKNN
mgnify:CR=1 FL=1